MTKPAFIMFLDSYMPDIQRILGLDPEALTRYRYTAETYYQPQDETPVADWVEKMKAPIMRLYSLRHEVGDAALENALRRPLPGTEITRILKEIKTDMREAWTTRLKFKRPQGGSNVAEAANEG